MQFRLVASLHSSRYATLIYQRGIRDSMATKKQLLAHFKRSLWRLTNRGWTKHDFRNSKGEYCALGALRYPQAEISKWAKQTLERELSGSGYRNGIISWNDSTNRRKRDVVAMFKRVIKKLEAE